ncbi:DUF87 domain-containing protein [Leptolyngbya sp. FACHB-321]|uniref:helicase HerA domain-containing protein n=1 Tax=Leptolyngbya sp. FACHB-321 TaxID=2692807 RepID=UPI0018F02EB4|nr:DUF87 domain-containing protein [Leptolyngbya sp. FACHB-321]
MDNNLAIAKRCCEAQIAPDYEPSEFAPLTLLEQGDVDVWLRRRGVALINKSKETAKDCEAGKLASAITVGASVVMSANPLAWLPLTIGAIGYVYTVFQEFQDTGSIRLIPMYRGKLGDILRVMEGGQAAQRHPLEDQIEYLSEAEKDEVLLINYRFGEIAGVLNSAPPKVRFDLYRHLCGQFHARRDLMSGDEVKHYINAAVSQERRTAMPPQSQPTIEQGQAKAIAPEPVDQKPAEQKQTEVTPSPALSAQPRETGSERTPTSASNSTKWINNFVSQTALIWGNQGSGKSWMARYIAKLKKDKGYRVVVLDPDSNRAEWQGIESYHDFDEIADFLRWYVGELMARYKAFNASNMTEDAWRAKLWADGKAIALICEEVTTYVDLIEDKELLTQFFRLGLTKSRKQEMPLTFVSHNNNQTALGGIKGLANLIEKMLQLELQTDIDPETLQPVASGKGAVKLDGSNQWVPVTLPKLERKITNFGEVQPTVIQQPVTVTEPAVEPQPEEEAIAPTETTTELKVSDSLAEPLKSIWLFTKEQQCWVTVRDIQRKNFAVLKGKSSEQIHQYLGLLSDGGYGEIDEEGKSHSSVAFLAH